jgi:hypothetical protein
MVAMAMMTRRRRMVTMTIATTMRTTKTVTTKTVTKTTVTTKTTMMHRCRHCHLRRGGAEYPGGRRRRWTGWTQCLRRS